MAVEIVDFDDAFRDYRRAIVALHYSAWGRLDDLGWVQRGRRSGFPFAPYLGVYAREGDALLSAVFVSRYPLMTPDGPETVAGIELVITRPDAMRRGLAGRLLNEVHRRERTAGRRLSLLCTGRSNLAHELYLKLGYQDIFYPRTALRYIARPTTTAPPAVRVRLARPADMEALDRVHRRANAGALGFARRYPHSFQVRFHPSVVGPRKFLVAEREGRVVGYATLEPHPYWSRAVEVIAPTPAIRQALMSAVERRSRGRWVVFASAWFSGDDDPELAQYSPLLPSYAVMMACPLISELRGRNLYKWFRSDGRRFACQMLDMF